MKLISSETEIVLSLKCPICGAKVVVEDVDEWIEAADGLRMVSESGVHLTCETEPDIDADEWEDWHNGHFSMPYVDWLPLQDRAVDYINSHYRWVEPKRLAQIKLDAWNKGEAINAAH